MYMKTQDISATIDSLESFLADVTRKLTKKQRNELHHIITRLKDNLDKPDREELMQIALLFFRIMMQGAEIISHHHR